MDPSRSRYLNFSSLIAWHRRSMGAQAWAETMALGQEHPKYSGAALAMDVARHAPPDVPSAIVGSYINIGALCSVWWQARRRVIWRLRPETAARVAATGISYIPAIPPASWAGAAIIVEGAANCPLTQEDYALGAYQALDSDGRPRYWVVGLGISGDIKVWPIPSDLGVINDRMAREGRLLDLPELVELDPTTLETTASAPVAPDKHFRALAAIKFVFAFSFYLAHPDPSGWATRELEPGPPQRDGRGKAVHRHGRVVPVWSYSTLEFRGPAPEAGHEPGRLDTTGLTLAPTVVSAHWRRLPGEAERMILIPAHASQRWRRSEAAGTKVTL